MCFLVGLMATEALGAWASCLGKGGRQLPKKDFSRNASLLGGLLHSSQEELFPTGSGTWSAFTSVGKMDQPHVPQPQNALARCYHAVPSLEPADITRVM